MRLLRVLVPTLALALLPAAAGAQTVELVTRSSPYSVTETLDRLEAALEEAGITVFARIDHGANAEAAGLELAPMQLLIFGNPRIGAPLMRQAPSIGLDLPLRALAWEDENGDVFLQYTPAAELQERYAVMGQDEVFSRMSGALERFTTEAVAEE
jgi:uncharacterized protein (DUF302 family)